MRALEFETTLDSDSTITIPDTSRVDLAGKKVKVIVLYEEDDASATPTDDHYTKGYDQKDSLYDAY